MSGADGLRPGELFISSQDEFDAREALHRAAPELLDLLKHFVTGWELMPEHLVLQYLGVGWPRRLRMAKAAIEKAEGRV